MLNMKLNQLPRFAAAHGATNSFGVSGFYGTYSPVISQDPRHEILAFQYLRCPAAARFIFPSPCTSDSYEMPRAIPATPPSANIASHQQQHFDNTAILSTVISLV